MEHYPTTIPNPSLPINIGIRIPTVEFKADSGVVQRRKTGSSKLTFDFNYIALTAAAYKTLFDFYIARSGKVESFLWTAPDTKITYTVRFAMDAFAGVYKYHNIKGPLYELSIKLEQV